MIPVPRPRGAPPGSRTGSRRARRTRPVGPPRRHALYVDVGGRCVGRGSRRRCPRPVRAAADAARPRPARRRAGVPRRAGTLHIGREPAPRSRRARRRRVPRRARTAASPRSIAPATPTTGRRARPARRRPPRRRRHLDRLVGRGDGLTPLGDDVLCGWLAARARRVARPTRRRRGPCAAPRRTTLLSATLLDCALHGEVLPEFAAYVAVARHPGRARRRRRPARGRRTPRAPGCWPAPGSPLARAPRPPTEQPHDTERDHVELRPGAYADSVTLLQVSRDRPGHRRRRRRPGRDGDRAQRRGARRDGLRRARRGHAPTTWSSRSGSTTTPTSTTALAGGRRGARGADPPCRRTDARSRRRARPRTALRARARRARRWSRCPAPARWSRRWTPSTPAAT